MENIFQAIARALDVVGKKYDQKEYFLTELVMAARAPNPPYGRYLYTQCMNLLSHRE